MRHYFEKAKKKGKTSLTRTLTPPKKKKTGPINAYFMKTYQIFYISSDRVSTEPRFISLFLSGNGLYQYLRLIWKTSHYLAVKEKARWSFEDKQSVQIGMIGSKFYKIYFFV